jgi:precorrin-3B C17-methyltransferase
MKRLTVVGMGAGGEKNMTLEAHAACERAELIVGYTAYVDLIAPMFPGKETLATPMMREVERCRAALERADAGADVVMVCSGDAGVYGMASPILELSEEFPEVEVEVVAGVTAAQSGSAVLGAALSHDFACVSLSDLLTPWELIERRLAAVASADFCVALYNPRSKRRADHLAKAAQIMIEAGKSPQTVCGWVKNIGREGQCSGLTTLEGLKTFEADMFTTVYIGNERTRVVRGKMVTPRGYRQIEE